MATTPDPDVRFVSHSYERSTREDGRRCHKWFLVDEYSTEHLAVVGVETDTMDGHYNYNALEPFASRLPLACGNQAGVANYLQQWLQGLKGGAVDEEPQSGTHSGGASSGCVTGGHSSGRRKAFVSSLCSSRQAVLNAAGTSPVNHHAGAGGSGRGKHKGKQTAVAAYSMASAPKQKSVGIVQQNQIKKARKVQEDIRAEQERLISGHLARLRRAAGAELQSDNAAKQVALSWVQGSLTGEELEVVEHWRNLLATVLDLQQQPPPEQQQRQPPKQQQPEQQQPEQQEQEQDAQADSSSGPQQDGQAAAGQGDGSDKQQQQPQQQQQQDKLHKPSSGGAHGTLPEKLLAWLQQPESRQHYVRVMLECLRELAAADIPARVLMQHKLIALVQRCKCEQQQHEAVRSLAQGLLTRWRGQLAGHMQVLTNPLYMQDHLGVLEEEVAAGQVPLPQLPKYKKVLLNTALPVLPGGPGSRGYTPQTYSNHYSSNHLQQLQRSTSSMPQLYDAALAAAAAGFSGCPAYPSEPAAAGYDGAAAMSAGFNPGNPGYYTPVPSLLGVQRAASPGSAAALGAAGQQQHLGLFGPPGQAQLLPQGQQLPAGGVAAATGGLTAAGNSSCQPQWLQVVPGASAAQPANSSGGFLYSDAAVATGASQGVWGEQQQQMAQVAMQQQQ